MYCYNCGKQIEDNAVICIHCGVEVARAVGTVAGGQIYNEQNRVRGFSIAGFVLSFFGWLSILGLLFSCIGYKKSVEQKNSTSIELAISGILISICDFVGFTAGVIVFLIAL